MPVLNQGMPRDPVSAVIFYGSAYHLSGQPFNKGTATSGQGDHAGKLYLPPQFESITQDWCNE